MPRIGIVGFMHESNTFSTTPTTKKHFEEAHFDHGPSLIAPWKDAHHEIGGFLQGCSDQGLEIVPILAGWATPAGPLTSDTYEGIVSEILEGIRTAGRLDGILLALHGAMVSDHYESADGETVRRIRELVGKDFPLVMTLDLHGNISPAMVEHPDATIVYRTYPHLDQRERGIEAANLIARMVRDQFRPTQAFRKIPILIHIVQQYTEAGPMAEVYDLVNEIAESPGILSASFAPGYIYADVPDMGATAIVVADNNPDLAEEKVQELADFAFAKRAELNAELLGVEEAVREAASIPDGPISLMDCGDNIGGGGPGDSTHLFAEVRKQDAGRCCVILYDPGGAKECESAGIGGKVTLEVGGKTDDQHGAPVSVVGTVRYLSNGKYEEPEARHGGNRFLDQGLTAVVETDDNHTVVINSLRIMPTSLQQILSLEIDPKDYHLLIVKGVTAPRAAYGPVSTRVIPVDTLGVTQAGPESFIYHRRPVPLYPLESVNSY